MSNGIDIAICILPKIQPDGPTVGPAVLKSHCTAAGFSARVVDLNIDLFNSLGPDNKHFWYESDDVFFREEQWNEFYAEHCEAVFERWADELVAMNARFIGLSVFSNRSVHPATKLISLIKQRRPQQQIVVGGAGTYHRQKVWHKHGADFWIMGDAEVSLIELLRGNTEHEGINNTKAYQIEDLDTVLYPDYTDIDFSSYTSEGAPARTVYITGSRGCVRDCTFCDVASMWPKYRYRSGDHIAGEMIAVRQSHGVDLFEFTDSLVNGSLKAFRQMCQSLADYRERTGDRGWSWSSQFICRSATQMTAEDYALMKRSGCGLVSIGIESASYSVRTHMRKGFTNDDMWHTFNQLKANEIRISLMMMVGYPTETSADFEETMKFLRDLRDFQYFDTYTSDGMPLMSTISFGPTMEIYSGSPMHDMQHDMGITRDGDGHWLYGNNNIRVRIIRLLKAYAMLSRLGHGKNWWMANRRNKNLRDQYTRLSGRNLPEDILAYDERLEYEPALEVA